MKVSIEQQLKAIMSQNLDTLNILPLPVNHRQRFTVGGEPWYYLI